MDKEELDGLEELLNKISLTLLSLDTKKERLTLLKQLNANGDFFEIFQLVREVAFDCKSPKIYETIDDYFDGMKKTLLN